MRSFSDSRLRICRNRWGFQHGANGLTTGQRIVEGFVQSSQIRDVGIELHGLQGLQLAEEGRNAGVLDIKIGFSPLANQAV